MKCPVCGNVNTSMVCLKCGFDSSRNYGKYPTLGPVGEATSVSSLRAQWQEKQKTMEPVPTEPQTPAEPVKTAARLPNWLVAVACVVVLALGIGIGSGLGGGKIDPSESGESVQTQEPVVTTTAPPETSVDSELWRNNILRSDEVSDVNGDGFIESPDAKNSTVLGSNYRRDQICSVTFLDTLSDLPDDAWDVSEAGDGTVMAWVELTEDTELYDLYIGAEGGVKAGESCYSLFMGYENAESITFGNAFHTEDVQDMCRMFYYCVSLSSLNLSSFDTSNVQDMRYMFSACSSLTELTLGDRFDTSNVQDMRFMFSDCRSLTELTLGDGFDTSNVQNMGWMFSGCSSLTELTLGDSFVTTNADTTDMFKNCPAGDKWGHLVN